MGQVKMRTIAEEKRAERRRVPARKLFKATFTFLVVVTILPLACILAYDAYTSDRWIP